MRSPTGSPDIDTKSAFSKVKPYSSNTVWPKIIKAADNYLRRLPIALLHKGFATVRSIHIVSDLFCTR